MKRIINLLDVILGFYSVEYIKKKICLFEADYFLTIEKISVKSKTCTVSWLNIAMLFLNEFCKIFRI